MSELEEGINIDHTSVPGATEVSEHINNFADELSTLAEKRSITGFLCFVKHDNSDGEGIYSTIGQDISGHEVATFIKDLIAMYKTQWPKDDLGEMGVKDD